MELSSELALALYESTDAFPVDFDLAWKWMGYSSKQKAKNKLTKNFVEGLDYTLTQKVKRVEGNRGGGLVQFEAIKLTLDCLKSLGMMAGTEQGKQIRRYFLECEKIAKQAASVSSAQSHEIQRLELELELARTQDRLLQTTQAIATLHGSEMVALILGKPDAVLTRTERVETLVPVDAQGRALAQYDDVGITYQAKRYGFGKKTQACSSCHESSGVSADQRLEEPALVKAQKISDLDLRLDRHYLTRQRNRQQQTLLPKPLSQ